VTVLAPGLVIRAYGGTKPNRPGVVLRLHQVDGVWYAFVAFGTWKEPPPDETPEPVLIDRGHPAFVPLRLNTPTWFRRRGGAPMRDDDQSVRIVGTCPPDVLIALRELCGFR
jgi:hypothetical protein